MSTTLWCQIEGFCPLDRGMSGVAPELDEALRKWLDGTPVKDLPVLREHFKNCSKCQKAASIHINGPL